MCLLFIPTHLHNTHTHSHAQTHIFDNIASVFPHLCKRGEIQRGKGVSSFHYSDRGKGAKLRFTQICKSERVDKRERERERKEAFHLKHAKTTRSLRVFLGGEKEKEKEGEREGEREGEAKT